MEHPTFTVDDGYQPPVTIMCKDRNVLVATFSRLLLSKIGELIATICVADFLVKALNQKKNVYYVNWSAL